MALEPSQIGLVREREKEGERKRERKLRFTQSPRSSPFHHLHCVSAFTGNNFPEKISIFSAKFDLVCAQLNQWNSSADPALLLGFPGCCRPLCGRFYLILGYLQLIIVFGC
ncbi:hypothetical protein CsSME_00025931 [Camellia sinensis var. sinensis]